MKVREMIEQLGRLNLEAEVQVWNTEFDHVTNRVFVSSMLDGSVMVSEVNFESIGKRMAAPRQPGGIKGTAHNITA